MKNAHLLVVCGLVGTLACAQHLPPESALATESEQRRAAEQAKQRFGELLDRFAAHDRDHSFTPAVCSELGREFEALAARSREPARSHALYNAGLAYARCGFEESAQRAFTSSRTHHAQTELALADLRKSVEPARVITRIEQIVRESKFADPRALVALAALQMQRGRDADFEQAKLNLQRALAIDDGYAPAQNQLALLYLALAKPERAPASSGLVLAGTERRASRRQTLDLGMLVVSQALARHPEHAPLHNTAGLIQVELGVYNGAIKSFARARELDPRFFEAHMNYGAVSLSLRGISEAEAAYRAALRLAPNDYDAHVGLALALRGRSRPGEANVKRASELLAAARRIAPERPEAYYNEAILVEELVAKRAQGKAAIPILRRAQTLYREFAARADKRAGYATALERAEQRRGDIDELIAFLESS